MKTLLIFLFAAILFSCSDRNATQNVLVFELRLAETEPDPDLQEMVFFNTEKKFYIHDSVFISNDDLISAEVIDWNTQSKVKVTLNKEGRRKFAEFTLNNIGKNAAMIVDDKLVSAPRINAQITQGIFLIVGLLSQDEAQTIADSIVP
jgi:preprotein translocase subunit SecD